MTFNHETAAAIRELLGAAPLGRVYCQPSAAGNLVSHVCSYTRQSLEVVDERFHEALYANGFLRTNGKFPA